MFKLIALVTLKPGAPQDDLLREGRRLLSEEPNMLRFELHADHGEKEQFSIQHASFALIGEFESRAQWRRYVEGPIHSQFSQALAPWKAAATVIQFQA